MNKRISKDFGRVCVWDWSRRRITNSIMLFRRTLIQTSEHVLWIRGYLSKRECLVCPINIRIKKLTKTHAYLYTCFRPTKGGKLLYTDVQSAV